MAWFRALVEAQLRRYPGMEPDDLLKLAYQSEMGGEHLIPDEAAFAENLSREMALSGLITASPATPEWIGPGVCRVYLSALYRGPSVAVLARLCRLAAEGRAGGRAGLDDKLAALRGMAAEGRLPYPAGVMESAIAAWAARGCPPLHHSARYRALYAPHYRLMTPDMALYLPVFAAIDAALTQKPHVLCGIDGMSGAGKSRLAALLEQVYGCGVVHCDDFFLQPGQRNPARLAQPGGNIDYERLAPVAALAVNGTAFRYQTYDCQTGQMGAWRRVPESRLTLLEGVYALHPRVAAPCDVKVFLGVDTAEQARRVLARSGKPLAERFEREWIPMENRYFAEFGIREGADVALDTTELGA